MSDDSIDVKIGANADDLQAGVNQATQSMQAGIDQMVALLQKLVEQSAASTAAIVADEEKIAHAVEASSEASESAFTKMVDGLKEQSAEANESLEAFAVSITKMQKMFQLIGEVAMLGFVGEKIADLGKEFAEFAEQTANASKKTGLSTAAVQELGFAAYTTGVSAEGMNQALIRVSRSMTAAEGGSKQMAAVFDSVGISAKQLEDMSVDQVLAKVADKFSETEDGSTKAAIAMQLFGRQGAELIPLLDQGASGIEELRARAQELGVVMGEEDVEAGEKLNEKLDEMNALMAAVKLRAGSELAPAFLQIVKAMSEVDSKGGVLDTMFVGLGDIMKAIVTVALTAAAAFNTIAEIAVTSGLAVEQAATGNFSTAAATIRLGLDNITKGAGDAQAAIEKLWEAEKEGAGIDMGEGGADWSEKGKLKAPDASGGEKGPDQVAIWKEQLEQKKEASNDYFKEDLAGEEAFWEAKLALVAKGSKDYIAVSHELFQVRSELAHQGLADDLAAIKQSEDEEQGATLNKIDLANQAAQKIGAAYGFESAQYKAAVNEMRKIAKEWAADQTADADSAIQRQTASLLAGIARQEQAQQAAYKTHQESSQQETAALLELESQKYAIQEQGLARELALYDESSKAYKNLLKEQEKVTDAHATAMAQITNKGAQQTQQDWDKAFRQVNSTVSSSIMGMIRGTETFQQSAARVADQVLNKMIQSALEGAEHWIENEFVKTAATTAGNAARMSSTVAAGATSAVAEKAAAGESVTTSAYRAAAAVYADVAEIPYVGWLLAPPAAAVAFTAVEAFMPSAAGGYFNVPNDGPVNIHKGEMVLPAWAAQGVRSMITSPNGVSGGASGGGNSSSAGGANVNLTYNVQCPDPNGFKTMLMKNADTINDAVRQSLRDGRR
jgi:hypothetical protein